MSDSDKQALIDGTATIQTKIDVLLNDGTVETTLTETNSVIDWNYEDFRQVKDEGWIGQFVARQVTGNLKNLSDDFKITDKELELKLGVRTNNNTNWYSLGNFLVTKVTDDEVNDKTSFEALDYTKKFNKAYEDTIEYPCTALQLAQNVCAQCGVVLGSVSFRNDDYVITGNVFTNNESCRDVMKAIGKLAFSWVRIDWDNKVYIDFDPTPFKGSTTPSQYNTFGNNKYYNLKTQKEVFGPVDKVVIGYSAIEGERTYTGSEDGTCVINIFDNPLVFNQEQRASIIESASDLLGMTYTPLNTLTVGHPWLKGNELVRVVDMEGVSHDTIPLDRTIQYFGHIKTLINSNVETKTNDNLAYKPEMSKNYERSEIYNDQVKKQIGLIIEEQGNTNNRLNETVSTLDGTIQRVSKTETSITDITTTTQSSTGKNSLYLEDAMEGNVLSYSVDGASEQETREGKNRVNRISETLPKTIISPATGYTTISIFYDDEFVSNYQTNGFTIKVKLKNALSKAFSSFALNSGWTKRAGYSQFTKRTKDGFDIYETYITNTDFTLIDNYRFVMIFEDHDQTTGCDLYDVEVDLGNTVGQDFEKYGQSPTPNYPSEIKNISSKNLINTATAQKGYFYNVNAIGTSNNWYIQQVPVKSNTTYYLSGNNKDNTTAQIWLMDENKNRLSTVGNYKETHEITTSSTTAYIGISIADYEGTADMNTIRLDELPYNIKVKVTGKNIFDITNVTIGRFVDPNTLNIQTTNNAWSTSTNYIPIQSNSTITISAKTPSGGTGQVELTEFNKDYQIITTTVTQGVENPTITKVLNENTKYVWFGFRSDKNMTEIQAEENTEATTYEEYKEKQVLIDLSKENLFDSNNVNKINNAFINPSATSITSSGAGLKLLYIPITGGKTYTINKKIGKTFRVGTCIDTPAIGTLTYQVYERENNNEQEDTYTITTNNDSNYLLLNYYRGANPTEDYTEQEILNSITIYESNNSTPYYELCKVGDNKDRLVIDSNGNCVINKKIGKVVLNGSENWKLSGTDTFYIEQDGYPSSTHDYLTMSNYYIYSTWDNRTNTDYNTGLYRNGGWSTTRLFIRNKDYTNVNNFKTWLSTHNTDVYYVLATPETVNLPNTKIPLFEGINHITLVDDLETDTSVVYYRKTPLSGTYATLTQLNEVSTEKTQEIQTVRQEVLTEITNESLRIDVVRQEIDETGVPILNTGTGYTFDLDGLKMEKTDQDVKSQLDNDGLSVKYKNEDVLTARSNGVNAVNMTVNKFYIQKPIRMEKTKSISDSTQTGLGFFYIGE